MKEEKITIKTLISRLKAETPVFWKKVRRVMVGAGAVGLAIKAAVETNSVELPWLHQEYYDTLIIVGVIGTALTSLTVKDNGNAAG